MDFTAHGYLLIAGLTLIGAGLVIISVFVNREVVHSALREERHREKLFEYYRNTFSQLGVILISIGISLFIFFFQQNYKDEHDRDLELQQVLAKMAMRMGRGAPLMEALNEYDAILDKGGTYIRPEDHGANGAVRAKGSDLARQVHELLLADRDIDFDEFQTLNFSRDFESSLAVSAMDADLRFNIARDESYLTYALTQIALDYKDLRDAIDGGTVEAALADPERARDIKREALDILYDADLMRDRSRRLLGRACWLVDNGLKFVVLKPISGVEADYKSHEEWLKHAKESYGRYSAGKGSCFDILHYSTIPPK